MALGATVHRVTLAIADIDRGYYADHTLRVARHPSETDERMMVRIVAFALHATPALEFGGDLSTDGTPDLCEASPDGRLLHWIGVGLPEPKSLRKAAARAERVTLVAYGTGQGVWWRRQAAELARIDRLAVVALDADATRALAATSARTMALRITVQDGVAWIDDGETATTLDWAWLQRPRA